MAIIGINPTDFTPRKRTALDSIALGVDVASKILGAGAAGVGAYSELFGPKAKLMESEIDKNKSALPEQKMRAQAAAEKEFNTQATVESMNNLNDMLIQAVKEAPLAPKSRAHAAALTTKYMQAQFPTSNIRLTADGNSVATDNLTSDIRRVAEGWNKIFDQQNGMPEDVAADMLQSIKTAHDALYFGKYMPLYENAAKKAELGGVDFSPFKIQTLDIPEFKKKKNAVPAASPDAVKDLSNFLKNGGK